MNISQVAAITKLSAKSLRFYESKGLISPPYRSENGYRQYNKTHIDDLLIIARARKIGFSLDECKALLELANSSNRTSAEVKQKALQKRTEIMTKIEELTQMKEQLDCWIDDCPGDQNHHCPIIEGLKEKTN